MAKTDEELISEAREGDNEAFREIVNRYESLVASTVIGMLGRCPEADDVGQETFIRFYNSLKKFRGESGVGTYLTRIAINLSLNELKRRKRRMWIFPGITEEDESRIGTEDEEFDRKETKSIVQQAIHKLAPEFRSVIVLRLISGYTPDETANILGIPVGTVFSRLARAQKKLKVILKDHLQGEI
ncbi:RNA polymerase sigma factor [candidate division KSB1 bacterium]